MTQSGTVVGGSSSCNHKYGPIVPMTQQHPKRQKIVYPSDAERNWLRIIDQNKAENDSHYKQFQSDVTELNRFKATAMQEIASKIQTLQTKLRERQDEMENELAIAFEERQDKMRENMKALKEHKIKNEETKESSEKLLVGDEP